MSTFDVILTGPGNWKRWHQMVELKAMCCGFQKHIDINSNDPLPTAAAFNHYFMVGLKDSPSTRIYTHKLAKKEYDEYRRKSDEMLQFICERVAFVMNPSFPKTLREICKTKEDLSPRSLLQKLKSEIEEMSRS
ncbi:hypothetical protein FQN51_004662 [Onygenales sp. PD_10]|nr:hypothetical protein FQN51_004662 [Onygenales sp. PD_10]